MKVTLFILDDRGDKNNRYLFFCVGVVYSGEYDVCDVTLSVHPNVWASIQRL